MTARSRKAANKKLAGIIAKQVFIILQVIIANQNPQLLTSINFEDDLTQLIEIVLNHEDKRTA